MSIKLSLGLDAPTDFPASGAPLLSSPISVDALKNIISGVSTTEGTGRAYTVYVLSPSSEPTKEQIVDGKDSTGADAKYAENRRVFRSDTPIVFQKSGVLTADTDYDCYAVQQSASSQWSNITKVTQNTYNTAILSAPLATAPGVGVVTPECTSDYYNGEMYFVVVATGDGPNAAQVHLGKNASGANAFARSVGGDNLISGTGKYTFAQVTGLAAGTYDLVFAHTPERDGNTYSNTQTVNFTVT